MTRFGISIEKETLFRGVQHPFANVYHYEANGVDADNLGILNGFVDQIVTTEKKFHSSSVTFVRARVWNTGSGSQADNRMRVDRQLSGVGSASNDVSLDRERAILVRWPAGFNSRGKPVYLRKWYHTCGTPTGVTFGTPLLSNTAGFSVASGNAIVALADELTGLEALPFPAAEICAQSGRKTTGGPQAHPFLEHHQLGDQWR